MAVKDNAGGKRSNAGTTGDIDTIIPLLFAAHPDLMPNYKKMAALDDKGRTASALEHKFRKWRQASREVAAAHPDIIGDATPKAFKPRTPKKAEATETRGESVIDEDGDFNPKAAPKKRPANASAGEESPTKKPRTPKKAAAEGAKKQTNARKAKSDVKVGSGEDGGDGAETGQEGGKKANGVNGETNGDAEGEGVKVELDFEA